MNSGSIHRGKRHFAIVAALVFLLVAVAFWYATTLRSEQQPFSKPSLSSPAGDQSTDGLPSNELNVVQDTFQQTTSKQEVHEAMAGRNVSIPPLSVEGRWHLVIGEGNEATPGTWRLKQQGQLLTGDFNNQPVTGWIKGNTFNVTFRQGFLDQRIKFKYRGVIAGNGEEMQGLLFVEMPDKQRGETIWVATKS